jgi:short-subunit dehydrogenase
MKNSVEKLTALITGASSGMGYEFARQLAEMEFHIVAVSNEKEKLEEICATLSTQYKVNTWPVFMDLGRTEAASELFDYCQSQKIEIDILINNAGIFFYEEATEVSGERAQLKMLLHMVTPSLLCTYFGKAMKQRKKGYILNMSSISAYMPYPGISYYASTKRYLKTFSRALRSELLDDNIGVTCVCPGAVATNLFDRSKIDYDKALRWGIMMLPEKVVKIALRGMFRKKSLVTPGILNVIIIGLVRIAPQWLIMVVKRRHWFGL